MDKEAVSRIELLLRSICFNIRQKGREILSDFNITPPQFNALQFLVNEGELTISELSARLFLAPSTITDLVDRMEKNSLVIRVRDTKDRRIVKIQVQDKGDSLINKVVSRRCEYLSSLLKEMSAEDMQKFIGYLDAININAF